MLSKVALNAQFVFRTCFMGKTDVVFMRERRKIDPNHSSSECFCDDFSAETCAMEMLKRSVLRT